MTRTRGPIAQRYPRPGEHPLLRRSSCGRRCSSDRPGGENPAGVPSSKPGSTGRVTPSQKQTGASTRSASGRYTPPIPRTQRQSPRWFPFVIIGLLVVGLVVIIGNYAGAMPGGTHDGYLIGGIAAIVVGLIL